MGGRGGAPMKAAAATPAPSSLPTPTNLPRLKPKDLRQGMWVFAPRIDRQPGNEWHQVGSISNRGRSGRNTYGQFVVRDTQGRLVATLSPNASLIVDKDRV